MAFSSANVSLFGLYSVVLAGYSVNLPDFSVQFVGHLSGGGTINTTFSGSGTQFQTFYFGPGWSALASVEVPGPDWSLDNLIVVVPELGTARFVFLAVLLFSVAALKQGALPKTHEKALVQVFGRGAE